MQQRRLLTASATGLLGTPLLAGCQTPAGDLAGVVGPGQKNLPLVVDVSWRAGSCNIELPRRYLGIDAGQAGAGSAGEVLRNQWCQRTTLDDEG